MDDLVCINCSTPLPGGSKYCNECGTPVPGQGEVSHRVNNFPTDLRQALQMATAGEYEIYHELGRGGMGSVFLAREIGLDRLVAVKVLPPSLMFDEGLIVRFKREAKMVAKLHHPNIIPVYRVHHTNNLAFYTMHFVSGRSLSEIMASKQVLTLAEIERIMLEAAAGLGCAHKRGVIHRDVKPANILLDADGHVHLTDFGIAKALVGNTHLTETGAVIGTPQYMAPEQCEGRPVDGRADQYSLAVVGYQLLVGHPPFESDSMKELLYHHLFTPPLPLNSVRPETPLPLRDAIHKALSKDPADRFDSMEDLAMAIEGKGPPIFIKWLDEAGEVQATPPTDDRQGRAADLPTTKRLPDAGLLWGGARTETPGPRLSTYHRTVGALAMAVLSIGAVAVLALFKGAGLAGSLTGNGGETVAQISAMQPGVGSIFGGDNGNSADHDPEAGQLQAASAQGRLVFTGDLPVDARLEIDGQPADVTLAAGSGLLLPRGSHHISIGAPGFVKWESEIYIDPEATVELPTALVPIEVARESGERSNPAPAKPSVPNALLDQLDQVMAQGQELWVMGRYPEAAEAFREVERTAREAAASYQNGDLLVSLADKAASQFEKLKLACLYEEQPNCPK